MVYDADILINTSHSPYYQPMLDSIVVDGKGFKGPSMHHMRGYLLNFEVASSQSSDLIDIEAIDLQVI